MHWVQLVGWFAHHVWLPRPWHQLPPRLGHMPVSTLPVPTPVRVHI